MVVSTIIARQGQIVRTKYGLFVARGTVARLGHVCHDTGVSKQQTKLGRGLSGLLAQPVQVKPLTSGQPAAAGEHLPSVESQAESQSMQVVSVPVDQIVANRYQPRRNVDSSNLDQLADSIRATGLIQPIAVRRIVAGQVSGATWEIVAGERRWRAAKLAGLTEIPAILTTTDDRGAAEWAIVENVQREDLNAIDRGWAFRNLVEHFGLSIPEVGRRVGMDRSTVSNYIRLTELEPEIQRLVTEGAISGGHARALLAAPASPHRVAAAVLAAQDGWSVRQTEAWASEAAADATGADAREKHRSDASVTAERAELERQLSDHLGTRVRVQANVAGKGRLIVEFYDLEHFDGLMRRLGFQLRS